MCDPGKAGGRGRPQDDLDGPLDPDLPLKLLLVMALCTEAERLVPDRGGPDRPNR
ncbi:hypothetical protein GCM10010106_09580 [Thermopolyspora flexuosa]|uniref:hypothetical protein n=1 Tax=Thermopolyspora flexuosa TaxID=103836 RepID=UPI0014772D2F|nr:hypothetical protein [Thermopolyspora flexuosa]GGM65670.1 hypothetical protein GCM10010106_09580 [Thermopolyspora flexuosa]